MKDAAIINQYQEAVKILSTFGISVTVGSERLSAQKYGKDGEVILFENFDTAAELVGYACGFEKAREGKA